MLLKKSKISKTTIILLAVFLIILVIGGIYFFGNSTGETTEQPSAGNTTANVQSGIVSKVPTLENEFFSDKQFLDFNRNAFDGFADQYGVAVREQSKAYPPNNLRVASSNYGERLIITWEAPDIEVTGYCIRRLDKIAGKYADLDCVDSDQLIYMDTDVVNGLQYSYVVTSFKANEILNHQKISIEKAIDERVTLSRDLDGGMLINMPDSNDMDFDAVEGIHIYRHREGIMKLLTRLYSAKESYFDSEGEPSDMYSVAIYSDYTESNNSLAAIGVPGDIILPGLPSDISVKSGDDGQSVIIKWRNPADEDFDHIIIYRSAEKGTLGVLIDPEEYDYIGLDDSDSDLRYYVDTSVEPDLQYYYTVSSIDKNGNQSSINILTVPYKTNPFEPVDFTRLRSSAATEDR